MQTGKFPPPPSDGLDEVTGPRGSFTGPVDLPPVISQRTQKFEFLAVPQKLAARGLGKMQQFSLGESEVESRLPSFNPFILKPIVTEHWLVPNYKHPGAPSQAS